MQGVSVEAAEGPIEEKAIGVVIERSTHLEFCPTHVEFACGVGFGV